MGPDEYHGSVNNSVYTNYIAKISLQGASEVATLMNKTSEKYDYYARRIYLPFDSRRQYHPEYDGYTTSMS